MSNFLSDWQVITDYFGIWRRACLLSAALREANVDVRGGHDVSCENDLIKLLEEALG